MKSTTAQTTLAEGQDELLALLDDVDAAQKRAVDVPYYVASDTAEDSPQHRDSGLALIDTGRSGDWPVARLCEWNTADFVASVCNAWPRVSAELRQRLAPTLPPDIEAVLKEIRERLKSVDATQIKIQPSTTFYHHAANDIETLLSIIDSLAKKNTEL